MCSTELVELKESRSFLRFVGDTPLIEGEVESTCGSSNGEFISLASLLHDEQNHRIVGTRETTPCRDTSSQRRTAILQVHRKRMSSRIQTYQRPGEGVPKDCRPGTQKKASGVESECVNKSLDFVVKCTLPFLGSGIIDQAGKKTEQVMIEEQFQLIAMSFIKSRFNTNTWCGPSGPVTHVSAST